MLSWNCLPNELRHEVIKKLDLRTRFRFRHVAKSCQELVDTVPLYIPYVALTAETKTQAKLTFYLGIERHIDVGFAKNENGTVSVEVSETSCGKTTKHGNARTVKSNDAALMALIAFKHATMHPATLCGGVDVVFNMHFILKTVDEADDFYGDRQLRTKILCVDGDYPVFLMTRLVTGELEEIRMIEKKERDTSSPFPTVYTQTKRMRVRMDRSEEKRKKEDFYLQQMYVLTEQPDVPKLFEKTEYEQLRQMPAITMHNSHDIVELKQKPSGDYRCTRFHPCGITIRTTMMKVEQEEFPQCEMRWTCKKCWDPFDHWYMMKKLPEYLTPTPLGYFSEGLMEKRTYVEEVYANFNGRCAVEDSMAEMHEMCKTLRGLCRGTNFKVPQNKSNNVQAPKNDYNKNIHTMDSLDMDSLDMDSLDEMLRMFRRLYISELERVAREREEREEEIREKETEKNVEEKEDMEIEKNVEEMEIKESEEPLKVEKTVSKKKLSILMFFAFFWLALAYFFQVYFV